jgi:23S rRNA (guanine745-N1)-methyltransferase
MRASLDPALRFLCCPRCRCALRRQAGAILCENRHAFDVARQGFVNLLGTAPPGNADTADMVEARARFLGAGFYAPLAEAIACLASQATRGDAARSTCIVDVGAGCGYYLARVLDACEGVTGVALDISAFAVRRAARCHARAAAVVSDAASVLPLQARSAAMILSVFAPRNPTEFHRVLHPRGRLLVVTPGSDHLASLREPLGLLDIEPRKDERLLAQTAANFELAHAESLAFDISLRHADALALLAMGPAAFHLSCEEKTARVAALVEPITTRASFTLRLFRPRGELTCP